MQRSNFLGLQTFTWHSVSEVYWSHRHEGLHLFLVTVNEVKVFTLVLSSYAFHLNVQQCHLVMSSFVSNRVASIPVV